MKAKFFVAFLFLAVLSACAHGKMGAVNQGLPKGALNGQTIFVEPISADDAKFSGDKSADVKRVTDEKEQIKSRFNHMIAQAMQKKGLKAQFATAMPTSGLMLTGTVTTVEHGSAAARYFAGFGAGSSNLYTDFTLTNVQTKQVLARFEIIATSGGSSGMGSFLNDHLANGSKQTADYLSKTNNGEPID